jgi:hypothetical protein
LGHLHFLIHLPAGVAGGSDSLVHLGLLLESSHCSALTRFGMRKPFRSPMIKPSKQGRIKRAQKARNKTVYGGLSMSEDSIDDHRGWQA